MAYGSEQGFRDWLAQNGYVLSGEDAGVPALLSRASAYIDAQFGARFKGVTTAVDQADQWPRSGVVVNGRVVPAGVVPLAIVQATYRAALAEGQGFSLSRNFDPSVAQVKREKVDVIETEYFQQPTDTAASAPVVAGLDGLLAPFLRSDSARAIGMWVV